MEGILVATLLPRQLIRGSTKQMLPGLIIVTIVLRFRDYTVALTISDALLTSFKRGETLDPARPELKLT
jgi:hypothetical protein